MSTVLVINSIKRNEWADRSFSRGDSVRERLNSYLRSFSDFPMVELVAPGSSGSVDGAVKRECEDSCSSLAEAFGEIFQGHERMVYFWSDTPFLDLSLTEKLLNHHEKYLSQYTFADGWPLGLTPEILERSAMEKLELLARGVETPLERDSLFTLIQKDINAFDLETLISPEDFRLLRLVLAADCKRNFLLLDRLDQSGLNGADSIAKGLGSHQELLRTLPAFFQFQITTKRLQVPTYLPCPDFTGGEEFLDYDSFQTMLDRAADFAGDGVISLSCWGEPAAHPRILDFMNLVLDKSGFRLLIETSGLGWDRESLLPLLKERGDRIDWIVEWDAQDRALYKALRGEGQAEAFAFIEFLGEHSRETLFVQTTRMAENEDYLEDLYQSWKERPGQLIIKKYDHYCGVLPPRKVTELAPWVRNACWHIKRDVTVLMDGTVLLCQEMLDKKEVLGNLLSQEMATIWEKGEAIYSAHLKGDYPPCCTKCDEYYTYNF
ncbi:MAG: spiro-SPASM protein [Spirochaetales bacterium]|nr:spiro-SPASM protein [Spirochaetales bacterium]